MKLDIIPDNTKKINIVASPFFVNLTNNTPVRQISQWYNCKRFSERLTQNWISVAIKFQKYRAGIEEQESVYK